MAIDSDINPNIKTKSSTLCYCEGERDFSKCELQCCLCSNFFHIECVSCSSGPLVPLMTNYQFFCKKCSQTKPLESFQKKTATLNQLCITALANLTVIGQQETNPRIYFSRDKEIIPFIEDNWDALTFNQKKVKSALHSNINRTLTRDDLFLAKDLSGDLYYSLRDQALDKIGPLNERIKEIMNPNLGRSQSPGSVPVLTSNNNNSNNGNNASLILTPPSAPITSTFPSTTSHSSQQQPQLHASLSANSVPSITTPLVPLVNEVTRRTSKRKLANENSNTTKRRGEIPKLERLVPKVFPLEYPYNKEGYRYHLAEPDSHSPFRQKFDETEVWAGKPIPGHLYRIFLENECLLSLNDRAQQLKLNDDRLSITGDKGYCSVRSTHSVSHGSWYYEVTISSMPSNSAARIGWAQYLANLQTPIGTDKFGYSWRSKKGTVFHEAQGNHYSDGYTENDVLGFLIVLPEPTNHLLPRKYKKLPLVKFKNYIYFEERDNVRAGEASLKETNGGKIIFYKNGINQGVAYTNIYEGSYYAAISVYYGATVTANFGPNFRYPPNDMDCNWKPMTETIPETYCAHALNDIIFHVSHDEQDILKDTLDCQQGIPKNSSRNTLRDPANRCRRLATLSAPVFE